MVPPLLCALILTGSGGSSDNRVALRRSEIHASLANHPWRVRQIGQNVRPKNTGVESKPARSPSISIEIARPVFGHWTIAMPMATRPRVTPLGMFPARLAIVLFDFEHRNHFRAPNSLSSSIRLVP